ncbi:MAG: hypothetical protein ACE5H9_09610 [Anaerolineae bacterium]
MLRKIWEGWKAVGRFIGNLLARIVLTLFYFTVFVPFGLGASLFGDQLGIKTVPDRLWRPRETPVDTLDTARRQA